VFSNSKVVSGAVTYVHLAALLFGGGFAVAADRAALRALRGAPERRLQLLTDLAAVHRPVVVGLAVLAVSGVLLFTADVETFASSPVFWTKAALVALLVGNGYRLLRTERALRASDNIDVGDPLWRRLRGTAMTSMALWAAVVLVGTALTTIS
jgi:K+ transporter